MLGSEKLLSLLDFYQFQLSLGSPYSMKILLDEVTLETYDRPDSKKYFEKSINWSLSCICELYGPKNVRTAAI